MDKLVSALGIDWKVLIAQVVNFAILFFVLKFFVYKPLLQVLKDRRDKIEGSEKLQADLEKSSFALAEEKEAVLRAARKESERIIEEARVLATKKTETILADGKAHADRLIVAGKTELQAEREKVVREIKSEAKTLLKEAIEKTLPDILDEHAGKKLVDEALALMQKSKQS